jgi:hypothetical protein
MIFQKARKTIGSNGAAVRSWAWVTRVWIVGWRWWRGAEDGVAQRGKSCGVGGGLFGVVRFDMLACMLVQRQCEVVPVLAVLVEGIDQVHRRVHGEAESAAKCGVGGAHRFPDRVKPRHDGRSIDDEPAHRVVQAAHRKDLADRFHDLKPRCVQGNRSHDGRKDLGVGGAAEPFVFDQRRHREDHGRVVGAPEAYGELIEAGNDSCRRRPRQGSGRTQPVVAAVIGQRVAVC